MPATTTRKARKTTDKPDARNAIAANILNKLGKPLNLWQVKVHPLWDDNYRVQVWCEINGSNSIFPAYRITDNFFVVAGADGKIKQSIPAVACKYDASNPLGVIEKVTLHD